MFTYIIMVFTSNFYFYLRFFKKAFMATANYWTQYFQNKYENNKQYFNSSS